MARQSAIVEDISADVKAIRDEIKRLFLFQQKSTSVQEKNVTVLDELSGNVVRHFYGLKLKNKAEPFPNMSAVLANLEHSRVEGTGTWLFQDETWLAWVNDTPDSPRLLLIESEPGMGKTYLSAAIYQQLRSLQDPDRDAARVHGIH